MFYVSSNCTQPQLHYISYQQRDYCRVGSLTLTTNAKHFNYYTM